MTWWQEIVCSLPKIPLVEIKQCCVTFLKCMHILSYHLSCWQNWSSWFTEFAQCKSTVDMLGYLRTINKLSLIYHFEHYQGLADSELNVLLTVQLMYLNMIKINLGSLVRANWMHISEQSAVGPRFTSHQLYVSN